MAGEASISLVAFKAHDVQKHDRLTSVRETCAAAGVSEPPEVTEYFRTVNDDEGIRLINWYDYSLTVYSSVDNLGSTSRTGCNPERVRLSLQELIDAGYDSIEFQSGGDW
jgi:hypothetical protein